MKFVVDSWSPEYDVSTDFGIDSQTDHNIDVDVERAADDWTPLDPSPRPDRPDSVVFVDGVRRSDARVWISDGEQTRAGVCASVAAGTVLCRGARASVERILVRRYVFAPSGNTAGPIGTRHGAYEFFATASDSPEDLNTGIHRAMADLEAEIAAGAASTAEMIIFDGPLRGRSTINGVGYIKTHHRRYLNDPLQQVIGQLSAGQRTPLFLLTGSQFQSWSWYMRLPGDVVHPMSGVVRCELPGYGTASEACQKADAVTATLPPYASEPHKDPRAPQNLYPIGGLERHLRHLLGDRTVIDRSLRLAAARS